MILSHFSAEPLELINPFPYPQLEDTGGHFKPFGLWLSDESDHGWKKWCENEEFNLERLKHETKFRVDMEGVLHLDSAEKVRDFSKQFSVEHGFLGAMRQINWKAVKAAYSGIIITPYFWELRLDMDYMWYYSWDCASGCVWDLSKLSIISQNALRKSV